MSFLSPKVVFGLLFVALVAGGGFLIFSTPSSASGHGGATVTVYKSSSCGCCTNWIEYMRQEGFRVEVVDDPNLAVVKAEHHVPRHLSACHTATVKGYTVEGHVPAEAIKRMLVERSQIAGIGVGGMPKGSPGMPGMPEPFEVESFTQTGETATWSAHGPGR